MNRLITAKDIATRDSQPSVREWIRITSIQFKMKGTLKTTFDGSVAGKPVYALVSNGRWLAMCDQPGCRGSEYVDPEEKVFYCLSCGNGNNSKGRPVIFPPNYAELEAALLERVMMPVGHGDVITQTFNARPLNPHLRRDWAPSELKGNQNIEGRVIVNVYGETPEMIRQKTQEVRDAGNS